jgi:adenine C2-methylase RlmN of 23S rRNA A2503 and tRNA A37
MFHHSKQTIFIEYIMLDGVNDQEEHAHQLCKLLETFKVVSYVVLLYYYMFYPVSALKHFKSSNTPRLPLMFMILHF